MFQKGLLVSGLHDSDYKGEIFISITNVSENDYVIHRGARCSQIFIVTMIHKEWLSPLSVARAGGFGSTNTWEEISMIPRDDPVTRLTKR